MIVKLAHASRQEKCLSVGCYVPKEGARPRPRLAGQKHICVQPETIDDLVQQLSP